MTKKSEKKKPKGGTGKKTIDGYTAIVNGIPTKYLNPPDAFGKSHLCPLSVHVFILLGIVVCHVGCCVLNICLILRFIVLYSTSFIVLYSTRFIVEYLFDSEIYCFI